jgi:hypothetical protein
MRNKLMMAALAALMSGSIMPAPALAQDSYYDHDRGHHHYNDHYRRKCGGGNGAVGTVAGGVGGALIGNAVGGGTAGTVIGGVGGALLGRHLDKKNTRSRNRC